MEGLEEGHNDERGYTLSSVIALTNFSSGYYDGIVNALDNDDEAEIDEITELILDRIGIDMARLINTYYL